MQKENTVSKRIQIGLLGFILSLVGMFGFGLTSIPSLILCVIGIFRKSYRILCWLGIFISIYGILTLTVWTPPGFVPYPMSIVKYSLNAPTFWLSYRFSDIEKAYSQYSFFGGSAGALYYQTQNTKPFIQDEIISLTEKNHWHLREKITVSEDEISKLLNEEQCLELPYVESYFAEGYGEDAVKKMELDKKIVNLSIKGFPFWVKGNSTILSFDTDNKIGVPSIVVINEEGTQMAIYCNGSR